MLAPVRQLTHVILLCDDIGPMKAFYPDLFPFAVDSESETSLSLRASGVLLGLRQRTRDYDGVGARQQSPGLQLAFRVEPEQVDQCHQQLVVMGVTILDPPTDQVRGHRTVYFADPEGNVLEVYAEI
jgi:catechol 2,3-dioxygenase-like lactoylglutathione lyase family enzyme